MPSKRSSPVPEIFQIKVTLRWSSPPIWRRLLVASDATLETLHNVLQLAMGWEFDHLHDFRAGSKIYGSRDPEESPFGDSDCMDERKVRLHQVLGRVGAKAVYTYDFGDGWEHNIVLEKRLPPDPKLKYPTCVAGKGACPPEDCGGIGGFYELVEAIQNPQHPRHDELLDWVGEEYDPEAFSVENVNSALAAMRRRARS